jgi:hypothetical protein
MIIFTCFFILFHKLGINFFVYLPAERIPNKLREAVEYQVSDHKNLIHAKAVIPKTVWIAEEVIEIFLVDCLSHT